MKSLRFLLSVAVLLILFAGYLGSQVFYFSRTDASPTRAPEWAQLADTPVVAWLALLILAVAVALSLVRDREGTS